MILRPALVLLAAGALLLPAGPAVSAPVDAKVGDVRAVFAKAGTTLRSKPSTLAPAAATLRYGTRVKVVETKKPWLRVREVDGTATGWLRAWKTVEPSALQANPKPPHLTTKGDGDASSREVSAAGRQLDAETERRFRANRRDLAKAYRLVDAMEAATQAIHPGEALSFIDEGNLGRRGRDYARPGRVKPTGRTKRRKRERSGAGGLLGKLGGEVADRLGAGSTGRRLTESLVESAADYVEEVKQAFSPEQEYFLGRAVAAQAIARYGVDPDAGRRAYVRMVGEAVVRLSDRLPANFGGYHFEVLDSDTINGVSGPGGFVLVTRGAVEACRSEAELAGILAHELAHIRAKHGEHLLRRGKEFPAMVRGLAGAARAVAGNQGAFARGLVQFFGKVAESVGATAIDHGYGRRLEFAADRDGTYILFDAFYEPSGLQTLLARLPEGHGHHGGGATHATPKARAEVLGPVVAGLSFDPPEAMLAPRHARFAERLGR